MRSHANLTIETLKMCTLDALNLRFVNKSTIRTLLEIQETFQTVRETFLPVLEIQTNEEKIRQLSAIFIDAVYVVTQPKTQISAISANSKENDFYQCIP